MIYGYVRVSTKDQNEDRQIIALKEMGVPEGNIYILKSRHFIPRIMLGREFP